MVVAALLLLELDAMKEMAEQEMKEGLYSKWERERERCFSKFVLIIIFVFVLLFNFLGVIFYSLVKEKLDKNGKGNMWVAESTKVC